MMVTWAKLKAFFGTHHIWLKVRTSFFLKNISFFQFNYNQAFNLFWTIFFRRSSLFFFLPLLEKKVLALKTIFPWQHFNNIAQDSL